MQLNDTPFDTSPPTGQLPSSLRTRCAELQILLLDTQNHNSDVRTSSIGPHSHEQADKTN
eukprot:1852754-Rhodomonas_salina.1